LPQIAAAIHKKTRRSGGVLGEGRRGTARKARQIAA